MLPVELGRQGSQALNLRVNKPAKLAFNNILKFMPSTFYILIIIREGYKKVD